MTQRRPLGRAGRFRRELNVDGLAGVQPDSQRDQCEQLEPGRGCEQIVKTDHPGRRLAAQADDQAKFWQARRIQIARGAGRDFRGQILQHSDVVAGLEPRRENERPAPHLVERVLELRAAAGGIDVYQHQSGFRRGELRQHPLRAVVGPDADALTRLETETQQPRGNIADPLVELAVIPAYSLMGHHQRLVVGVSFHSLVEIGADRCVNRRSIGGAPNVTLIRLHVLCSLLLVSRDSGHRMGRTPMRPMTHAK